MSAVKRVSNAEEVNENSPLIRINSEAASTSSTAEHNRNNNKDHNTISKESASRGRRQHRDSIDSQKSASSLTSNSSQSSLTYRDLSPGANAIRYSALSTNDLVTSPSASRRTSNISSTSVASSSSGTRQPFEPVTSSPNLSPDAQHTQNVYSRYKYYQKLTSGALERGASQQLAVPDHIVPSYLFILHGEKIKEEAAQGKRLTQGSVVTIFSIWNTLMGSSILSMPWAIQQSGWALAIFLVVFVGSVCLYTAILICRVGDHHRYVQNAIDWSDIVLEHLGRPGHVANTFFSILTLGGACLVYWVLMSNFLFKTVALFISSKPVIPTMELGAHHESGETWWWSLKTAPIFLVLLLLPAINMKEMTLFTKFNSLGVVSIVYILIFALQNLTTGFSLSEPDGTPMPLYSGKFPAMTGVLFLSFFVHNMVLAILRNNEHQDKNVRDISIAFGCTAMTYLLVGVTFFIAYKGFHKDIPSNILDSFGSDNYWALVCRVFLLFQIITVYPLICFVIRIQVFQVMYGQDYPGPGPVFTLNTIIVTCCVLTAIFYANVGSILKWTGAVSGTICVFILPIGVWLSVQKRRNQLTKMSFVGHGVLVLLAVMNFVAQFFV